MSAAEIAAFLGDAKPASDGLLRQLAASVRDRLGHEHPTWEDLYCLNLTSYMGERMGPVLRRLIDAEARVAELEATPLAWTERLDAKSLDNFLITLGAATEHEPMSGAIDAIHELLSGFRAAVSGDRLTALLAPTQALRDEWCTGCNTDHDPAECGYRPETGGASC
ncbi:hypothetical protein [Streptomyces sp. BH055]|uniref:hypothetical protein n=1 Tax=Streptomyces sp. BH055 TaxID=3401173 RepID=UPI003BB810EA